MKKGAQRLFGGAALLAFGGFGAVALLKRQRRTARTQAGKSNEPTPRLDRWARPGMSVTIRAELMLGRDRAARTFRVAKLLPSGRVTLEDLAGEHTESEFETQR